MRDFISREKSLLRQSLKKMENFRLDVASINDAIDKTIIERIQYPASSYSAPANGRVTSSAPRQPDKEGLNIKDVNNRMVAPLDLLARGFLGAQTADLANTLLLHKSSLQSLSVVADEIISSLISNEEHLSVENDSNSKRLQHAADLSDRFIKSATNIDSIVNISIPVQCPAPGVRRKTLL